jgi:hypothetical protein
MAPNPRPLLTVRSAHLARWLRLNHVEPLGIERDPRTPEIRYQWSYDRTPQVEQLFLVWRKTLNSFMHQSRFEEAAR